MSKLQLHLDQDQKSSAILYQENSHNRNSESVETLNKLFLSIVILFIFEGVLRKWIFPSLSNVLFFSKDPFVIYCYWIAFKYKLFPKDWLSRFSYIVFLALFVYAFIQAFVNDINPIITLIGFRNYAMLIPLAILMREYLSLKTIRTIGKIFCWLAAPTAILVFIQFSSPATAFINRNVGINGENGVFVVGEGVVRTSGWFSFNMGHAYFSVLCFLFFMVNLFLPKEDKLIPKWYTWIFLFACIVNSAVSGSRANWAHVGSFFSFFLGTTMLFLNKVSTMRSILYLFWGGLISLLLLTTVFERSLSLLIARQKGAEENANEDFVERALRGYGRVLEPITMGYKIYGEGLGMGSSSGKFFGSASMGKRITYESEWPRVIAEAGILIGGLFLILRITMISYLIYNGMRIYSILSNPLPLLFTGAIFWTLLYAQISFNGASYYYGWVFSGVALASVRIYREKVGELNHKRAKVLL